MASAAVFLSVLVVALAENLALNSLVSTFNTGVEPQISEFRFSTKATTKIERKTEAETVDR